MYEDDDEENDSDMYEDDDEDFTTRRLIGRENRYEKRSGNDTPLSKAPENEVFIKEMKEFLMSSNSKNEINSGGIKTLNHLFYYSDSWLNFESSGSFHKNGFDLQRLVCFANEDNERLILCRSPKDWIDSIAGTSGYENPSRR